MILGALAASGAGCRWGRSDVVRIVDGRPIVGPAVEPNAYAAFLEASLAEGRGDAASALSALAEAVRADPDNVALWTSTGEVRCRVAPRDRAAAKAFDRAEALDAAYAGLWEAKSRCALRRGETHDAARFAAHAAALDPTSTDAAWLAAQGQRDRPGEVGELGRARALTLRFPESAAAWGALAAWADAAGDQQLVAHALAHVARLAPSRRAELVARVRALAADGALDAAGWLAAAMCDASRSEPWGAQGSSFALRDGLVVRLAVDEALSRGDYATAERRGTVGRLSASELGARALLLSGDAAWVERLLGARLAADPEDVGASAVRMALASDRSTPGAARLPSERAAAVASPIDAAAYAYYGLALARRLSVREARLALVGLPHGAPGPGDALVQRAFGELAARGVLAETELAPEQRLELALRRGDEGALGRLAEGALLSKRHRLLLFAFRAPSSTSTHELARQLEASRSRDWVVAVAVARVRAARGAPVGAETISALLDLAPANALAAATAFELARHAGVREILVRARAHLAAVAATDAERALVTE